MLKVIIPQSLKVVPQLQPAPASKKSNLHMIWVKEQLGNYDRLVAVWTTQD